MNAEEEVVVREYRVLKFFSFAGVDRNPGQIVQMTDQRAAKPLRRRQVVLIETAKKETKTLEG